MRRLWLLLLLGLSSCQTSIDFEQGRPYTCVPDAGEDTQACGPGWRCGIEGRCHAIGDAKPWACRAPADCEAGWVCGLTNTCHDPTVLADYPCTTDEHCTAPWRCGFSGRCLDGAPELSTIADATPTGLTVLGPRFFTGQPHALVAASMGGEVAIALGTQVRFLQQLDAGVYSVKDFDAGSPGSGLMADGDGAYLVDRDGVRSLRVSGMTSGFVADGGRWFSGATRSEGPFVVHDDVLDFVGSSSSGSTSLPPDTLAVALGDCFYAVSPSGLWLQPRLATGEAYPMATSALLHQSCGIAPQGTTVENPLLRLGGRTRAVLGFSWHLGDSRFPPDPAGERSFVAAIDVTRLSQGARVGDPLGTGACMLPPPSRTTCGEARIEELLPFCPVPCDVGDSLTDLRPGDQALEVECTSALRQTTWLMRYDAECAAEPLSGRSSRFREVRTPGDDSLTASHLVQRGPHGQIWIGEGVSRAEPLVLDEPAVAVLRPRFAEDGGLAPDRVLGSTHGTRLDPQLGLLTVPAPETLAFVRGSDDLAVLRGGNISQLAEGPGGALIVSRRRAALDVLPEELKPPFTATLAQRADAGVLLVTAGDGLYGADEASWESKVPLRLVPQPGFSVLSLAVLPGPAIGGYLNTRSTVFAFSSASELEWTASPISLPPGQLVEVWADQGRARVGFSDGRVLTLPSGVPVASATGRDELVDYLGVCGQIFGLTRAGLLRVDGRGRWVPVPLPGGEVVLGDTLGGGRLLERDGLIYLFNGSGGGLTFRLSAGCP